MGKYDIITGLAFEFVNQGIWDTEDLERFVHSMMRRGWDQGFQHSQSGGFATDATLMLNRKG